jgi:hypothetical protein
MGFHVWNPLISSGFAAKSFSAEVVEIRGLFQAGTIHHMHLAVASLMRKDKYIDMKLY